MQQTKESNCNRIADRVDPIPNIEDKNKKSGEIPREDLFLKILICCGRYDTQVSRVSKIPNVIPNMLVDGSQISSSAVTMSIHCGNSKHFVVTEHAFFRSFFPFEPYPSPHQ